MCLRAVQCAGLWTYFKESNCSVFMSFLSGNIIPSLLPWRKRKLILFTLKDTPGPSAPVSLRSQSIYFICSGRTLYNSTLKLFDTETKTDTEIETETKTYTDTDRSPNFRNNGHLTITNFRWQNSQVTSEKYNSTLWPLHIFFFFSWQISLIPTRFIVCRVLTHSVSLHHGTTWPPFQVTLLIWTQQEGDTDSFSPSVMH